MISGVLNLDKPAGSTSARVVGTVKRLLPRGTKIGHAGTLDLFATGVLLLLIGKATKSCEVLMGQPKQYEATIKLGATTPTLDPESDEIPYEQSPGWPLQPLPDLSQDIISRALIPFIGTIEQIPPDFSALKLGGRRASDRVRDGEQVELKPRQIRIDAIELLEFTWPLIRLRIDCGRGTYVRSIARDLGNSLGVGGYLTQLRRTAVGPFRVEDAATLSELTMRSIEGLLLQPPTHLP